MAGGAGGVHADDGPIDDRAVVELLGDVVGRGSDQLDPALARTSVRVRVGAACSLSRDCRPSGSDPPAKRPVGRPSILGLKFIGFGLQ
jgi:hypothetical protein